MNSKKWTIILLSITMITVIVFGAVTYYLDPLLQYGKEPGNLSYRHYTEIYCNPGIAKNYDYSAVMVGSSMTENTTVAEFDELFDCKTIKVPYSGASAFNHKKILDVCFDSDNKIDKVFYALDEYALTTKKDAPRYPLPEYLYDYDKTNDLSYLLNLDVFYFYSLKDIVGTIQGENQPLMRDGAWTKVEGVYNKEAVLKSQPKAESISQDKGWDYYLDNLNDNLKYNIVPLLEEHPDTDFYFYMVPYSILYWYNDLQKGNLSAEIYDAKEAIKTILKYDNAKVFFFQDNKEIITNLDNYKDYSHFKPEINSYMTHEMAKGNCELKEDNYEKILDDFYKYLTNCNYDGFYEQ